MKTIAKKSRRIRTAKEIHERVRAEIKEIEHLFPGWYKYAAKLETLKEIKDFIECKY